jgi:hypothetical protein
MQDRSSTLLHFYFSLFNLTVLQTSTYKNYNSDNKLLTLVRKLQIAVIGYNKDRCTDIASKIAYEVGTEIARAGAHDSWRNPAGGVLICK